MRKTLLDINRKWKPSSIKNCLREWKLPERKGSCGDSNHESENYFQI